MASEMMMVLVVVVVMMPLFYCAHFTGFFSVVVN